MHNRSTLPIDKLLSKLTQAKVKQPSKEGLNQWHALCPSHEDKTPSLNITECTDGTILLKCWAGCSASEIVHALGLELKDLFVYKPACNNSYNNQPHKSKNFNKKHLSQQAINHEYLIIKIANAQLRQGIPLNNTDKQRYQLSVNRLKELNHGK